MRPENTISELREIIRNNPHFQRALRENGSVVLLDNDGMRLEAVRIPHSAEWSIEIQRDDRNTTLKIREYPDTRANTLIQIVEDTGSIITTTSYDEGDLGRVFEEDVYLDLRVATKRLKAQELRARSYENREAKIIDFALASQDPFFFNLYQAHIEQNTASSLSGIGHYIRHIYTFTNLEKLAQAASNADEYVAIIDVELDQELIEAHSPKKYQHFRNFKSINGYTFPIARFKKRNPRSLCILATDRRLDKEMVKWAGYDIAVRRQNALR